VFHPPLGGRARWGFTESPHGPDIQDERKWCNRFQIFVQQKLNGVQKLNLHNLKNFKHFCSMWEKWRCSCMASRSAAVDMAVKWRPNPRKRIQFAHGEFLWNFLRKPRWTVVTDFVKWSSIAQDAFLGWVVNCNVNSCAPSGHRWSYVASPVCYKKVLSSSSYVSFISVCRLVSVK
jgi:hypothetical protein